MPRLRFPGFPGLAARPANFPDDTRDARFFLDSETHLPPEGPMKTRTVTSDPAVALELGRRLAETARRHRRPSPFSRVWARVFNRHLTRLASERN